MSKQKNISSLPSLNDESVYRKIDMSKMNVGLEIERQKSIILATEREIKLKSHPIDVLKRVMGAATINLHYLQSLSLL